MGILANENFALPISPNSLYPYNPSLEDEMKRLFTDLAIESLTLRSPDPKDVMEEFRLNGRDYEYCEELEAGITPPLHPRRKKSKKPIPTECVFCKNNGEKPSFYREHILKDINGKVLCPILRAYECPICHVSGDEAHTIKYCPENKNPEMVATANALKRLKNSAGKRRTVVRTRKFTGDKEYPTFALAKKEKGNGINVAFI